MAAEFPWGYPSASGPAIAQIVGGVRKDVPAQVADADGDLAPVQLDAYGNVRVTLEGGKPTYSVAFDDLAAANSCTDLVRISGSATKTVFVQEIRLSATATAAKTLDVRLMRRSTANADGTSSAPTVIKHDADTAAGTAVVLIYTANPTVGTGTGIFRSRRYTIAAVDAVCTYAETGAGTGALHPEEIVFDLRGFNGGQGFRLEGVAQGLTVELDGESAGAANSWSGSVTWTELPTTA